jgi:hypothetical protein
MALLAAYRLPAFAQYKCHAAMTRQIRYLGTPQPLKHKSVGLTFWIFRFKSSQINTSAIHPKHKSFEPTFDFQPTKPIQSYIKGQVSVLPSFQKDSDVRAPSTYRHLRTWALRRVLAFGFVRACSVLFRALELPRSIYVYLSPALRLQHGTAHPHL